MKLIFELIFALIFGFIVSLIIPLGVWIIGGIFKIYLFNFSSFLGRFQFIIFMLGTLISFFALLADEYEEEGDKK